MRALATLAVLLVALMLSPLRAGAQSWADQPFDASRMSREDTATLQAALAFTSDYYGFLDGIWTADAQKALEAYVQRVKGRPGPVFRDLEDLILDFEDERVKHNWQLYHDERSNTSYLHPFGLIDQLDEASTSDVLEFLSKDEEFSMIIRYEDQTGMQDSHNWFRPKAKAGTTPYEFNEDNLWITSVTLDGDFIAYVRSDKRPDGGWVTLSVVVTQQYFAHLNVMASSVMVGKGPATLIWTKAGVIDTLVNGDTSGSAPPAPVAEGPKDQIRKKPNPPMPEPEPPALVDVTPGPAPGGTPGGGALGTPGPGGSTPALPPANDPPAPEPPGEMAELGSSPGAAPIRAPGSGAGTSEPLAPPTTVPVADVPKEKATGTVKSSGSGFYFDSTRLLTAAHVIDGCSAVALVDGTKLEILAADTSMDLAVLGGATESATWLKLSALEVPKLGEAVTVLGYPFYNSLDQGLTVTSGNVSALRGPGGDSDQVMITAPVQPGNSGGPLMNKKGSVIGVVVSRLDDMAVLEETGSLPQNMNFAVPTGPLFRFLAQNSISRPQGGGAGGDLSGELPEAIGSTVVPLHCYN